MIRLFNIPTNNVGQYTFVNFRDISEQEKKLIWEWRNNKSIKEWMSNSNEISWETHLKFILSLQNCIDKGYWLVYYRNEPIGVFDLVDIDYNTECAQLGYYLNPGLLNSGMGLDFNYAIRYFLYNILGFNELRGCILVGNLRSFTLSSFFKVHPYGLQHNGKECYILMRGLREDFNSIKHDSLLKDFYRYLKQNRKIDWNSVIKNLESESNK